MIISIYQEGNFKHTGTGGRLARSSMLKEISMNHDMRQFLLFLNDRFAFLNAELRKQQLTKKQTNKLYKSGNFKTTATISYVL
jgi:hypothetical protein